jgi:eukaryotic-like serine/threonine-protein kinase
VRRSSPSDADPADRWTRLDQVYAEARALPVTERAVFLERACADDPELYAELVSLLAYGTAGDALLPSTLSTIPDSGAARAAAKPDPLIGTYLHHYHIEARIGRGGMGVVYRARDTRLGRPVALKFIGQTLARDAAGRQRILAEARAAAAIDHLNICTVYEVGEAADGALFIAMACYEGETLKAKLARGRLPVGEAISLILQAAEGVRAAHQRGVVHHDIKPGNILVTVDGVVKLLDFGIARMDDASLGPSVPVIGTAVYTSPERVRGQDADARADIWSLGVLLYELLAGRRPFDGPDPAAALQAVLYESPPDLHESAPEVPAALEKAVRRALAKDAVLRQPSAEAFIAEIRAAAAAPAGAVAPRGSTGARRIPAAPSPRARVLAALVIALGIPGVLNWSIVGDAARDRSVTGPAFVGGVSTGETDVPSVAVLAFEDLSPEGKRSWFAEGLAQDVHEALGKMDGVHVSSTYSSFRFHGLPSDAQQVAARLGVTHLLGASVAAAGDPMSVTVLLYDTAGGDTTWTQTYHGFTADRAVRELGAQVAHDVARVLGVRLPTAHGRAWDGPDPETYDRYVEGRFYLRRFQASLPGSAGDLPRSVALLREVADRNPDWAQAWAALGEALHWVATHVPGSKAAFSESRDVLERAVALDPQNARALASLGYVLHRWELDHVAADSLFRRALEIDADQYFHCGYGLFLLAVGSHDDAIVAFERARAQDPLFQQLMLLQIQSYRCAGRLDEAITLADSLHVDAPFHLTSRRDLVLALAESGREAEALAQLEEDRSGHTYWSVLRALLDARAGRTAAAEAALRQLDVATLEAEIYDRVASGRLSVAALVAATQVALGRPDDAIGTLLHAAQRDPRSLLYDRCYRELAELEADQRYRDILRRAGLDHVLRKAGA